MAYETGSFPFLWGTLNFLDTGFSLVQFWEVDEQVKDPLSSIYQINQIIIKKKYS